MRWHLNAEISQESEQEEESSLSSLCEPSSGLFEYQWYSQCARRIHPLLPISLSMHGAGCHLIVQLSKQHGEAKAQAQEHGLG